MPKVTPNFHFKGQCRQAIQLYEKAFGARLEVLLCNSDADPQDYQVDKGQEDRVYHAVIYIGSQRLMMSDAAEGPAYAEHPLSLVVIFETADAVKQAYEALADGAVVLTPMHSTTYTPCIVSLVDRFGMRWELMAE